MIRNADLRAHKAKLRGIMDSILGYLTFMGDTWSLAGILSRLLVYISENTTPANDIP